MRIERVTVDDAPKLLNIYAPYVEETAISFEEAETIFYDINIVVLEDIEHSLDEDRFIAIGKSFKDNLLKIQL